MPRSDGPTFWDLLTRHATSAPTRVAVRERHLGLWRDITWATLRRSVAGLSAALDRLGLREGSTVAIVARPSYQWLVAELAALRLGGLVHTVDDRPLPAALRRLASVPSPGVILVAHADERRSEAIAEEVRRALADAPGAPVVVNVAAVTAPGVDEDARQTQSRGQLRLPTAGTSGQFRWVAVEEATVLARWSAFLARFDVGYRDRIVAGGVLDYWANRLTLLTTLLVRGAVLHFNDDGVADQGTRRQVRPTVVWSTAREWAGLAEIIAAEYEAAGPVVRFLNRMVLHGPSAFPSSHVGRLLLSVIVRPMLRQAGLNRARIAWAFGDRPSAVCARWWWSWRVPLWECYARAEEAGVVATRRAKTSAAPVPFERLGHHPPGWTEADVDRLDPSSVGKGRAPERSKASTDPPDRAARVGLFEDSARDSPYIREAVAYPDGAGTAVVLEPNVAMLAIWARRHRLPFSSVDRLVSLPEVQQLFVAQIQKAQSLTSLEVEKVVVVPDLAATRAGDLLSCSGRPRRGDIAETYALSEPHPHSPSRQSDQHGDVTGGRAGE